MSVTIFTIAMIIFSLPGWLLIIGSLLILGLLSAIFDPQ